MVKTLTVLDHLNKGVISNGNIFQNYLGSTSLENIKELAKTDSIEKKCNFF